MVMTSRKFFLLFTIGQAILLAIMFAYYSFAGEPNLNPSSPAFLYWWPIYVWGWGHATPTFFVGPFVAIAYSIIATIVHFFARLFHRLLTQKY